MSTTWIDLNSIRIRNIMIIAKVNSTINTKISGMIKRNRTSKCDSPCNVKSKSYW